MTNKREEEAVTALREEYGAGRNRRGAINYAIKSELPWTAPLIDAKSHIIRSSQRFGGPWRDVLDLASRLSDVALAATLRKYSENLNAAVDASKIRRYKIFNETFARIPCGVEILEIETIARKQPTTDSWLTVVRAVEESREIAKKWLKERRGTQEDADDAKGAPDGYGDDEKLVVSLMRNDADFSDAVKKLAFDFISKKMKNF